MQVDLIEVETKKSKKKIIIIVILALLFIVAFSVLGIYYAQKYNIVIISKKKELLSQKNAISNQFIKPFEQNETVNIIQKEDNKQEENLIENIEQDAKSVLPVYSELSKEKMKNIYNTETKVAYLTFDDGPSQAVTPLILDVLKKENIKATFFVLGSCVEKNPELLRREYLEGHYIANHGYTHNYSKIYKDEENPLKEFQKTEKIIQNALGNDEYHSHLFRFPGGYIGGKYGKIKKAAGKILNENDISYIDWNCLTGDAEGANTKEKILENIKKYTAEKGNVVILMHDAAAKILTYETLEDVIAYLRSEGYTFDNFYSIMS